MSDDYNEYQVFRNFIDTIDSQSNKFRLLEAYDDLYNDYSDVIDELNLTNEWICFNESAVDKFVKDWCYENHIEFK